MSSFSHYKQKALEDSELAEAYEEINYEFNESETEIDSQKEKTKEKEDAK